MRCLRTTVEQRRAGIGIVVTGKGKRNGGRARSVGVRHDDCASRNMRAPMHVKFGGLGSAGVILRERSS